MLFHFIGFAKSCWIKSVYNHKNKYSVLFSKQGLYVVLQQMHCLQFSNVWSTCSEVSRKRIMYCWNFCWLFVQNICLSHQQNPWNLYLNVVQIHLFWCRKDNNRSQPYLHLYFDVILRRGNICSLQKHYQQQHSNGLDWWPHLNCVLAEHRWTFFFFNVWKWLTLFCFQKAIA